jgi:hypothetical protein
LAFGQRDGPGTVKVRAAYEEERGDIDQSLNADASTMAQITHASATVT